MIFFDLLCPGFPYMRNIILKFRSLGYSQNIIYLIHFAIKLVECSANTKLRVDPVWNRISIPRSDVGKAFLLTLKTPEPLSQRVNLMVLREKSDHEFNSNTSVETCPKIDHEWGLLLHVLCLGASPCAYKG